jgi:hypothetical protein
MAEELKKTLDDAIATSTEWADASEAARIPVHMLAAAAMVKLGWVADE